MGGDLTLSIPERFRHLLSNSICIWGVCKLFFGSLPVFACILFLNLWHFCPNLYYHQILLYSLVFGESRLEKKREVQFHSIIDLSDKNLINLLYKLLKQSKRNELTWYIQHWLLLSKNWMSVLSAATAVIQFFRNKFFLLLVFQEIKGPFLYF